LTLKLKQLDPGRSIFRDHGVTQNSFWYQALCCRK